MKYLFKIIPLVLLVLAVSSCYNDNKEELYKNFNQNPPAGCDTSDTKFSSIIREIFVTNCALSGCHVGSSPQSGLDLSMHNDIATIAHDGRLETRITGDISIVMPPNNPLPECEIEKILKWVANGAQNN